MLSNVINLNNLIILIAVILVIVFSIVAHEFAHGYAAYLCGDDTAKIYGRLTLNPLKHIDWIGAICLAFFGFGWAKPVPVNSFNFKNYKRDIIIVSFAGVLANFVLAFVGTFILYVSFRYSFASNISTNILINIIRLNLGLALFNLIPLPPLDGSKILGVFLKGRVARKYFNFEKYGTVLLLLIFMFPFFGRIFSNILSEGVNYIYLGYINIIEFIFGVF